MNAGVSYTLVLEKGMNVESVRLLMSAFLCVFVFSNGRYVRLCTIVIAGCLSVISGDFPTGLVGCLVFLLLFKRFTEWVKERWL